MKNVRVISHFLVVKLKTTKAVVEIAQTET